ncbi:uncharacterized protein LOC108674650 [Hyalella azteca]|uniref:Uncharacterized protein LOC108674650 n=1 Tax=Hyalella azteca TaxID=294128 RepID=A0A8B7NWK4_HYAAZ|nr:uncharacterized protein LOC108674650 [Hyalella azteca]
MTNMTGNSSKFMLLIVVITSLGVKAGPQKTVLTTPLEEMTFCFRVGSPEDYASEGLTIEEQIQWSYNASLSLFMVVNVTKGEIFDAATSTVKVDHDLLKQGTHELSYRAAVRGAGRQRYLLVLLDQALVAPENESVRYHENDSSFVSVTVTSRGPITFKWNSSCSGVEFPADDPKEFPPVTTHYEDETDNFFSVQQSVDEPQDEKWRPSVLLWIVIGAASAVLLLALIAGVLLCIQNSSNSRKAQLLRAAAAERQKQNITKEAHRLSYIEQIRWTEMDEIARSEACVQLMPKT